MGACHQLQQLCKVIKRNINPPGNQESGVNDGNLHRAARSKTLRIFVNIKKRSLHVFMVHVWYLGSYGVRFWQNAPIHPQFVPLIGATFSAVLAFTLVFTLKLVEGPVDFEFGEKVKIKGATGPILMWCVCFLSITYGLYLMGITDVAKKDPQLSYVPCRVTDAVATGCVKPNNEQVAVQKPQEK